MRDADILEWFSVSNATHTIKIWEIDLKVCHLIELIITAITSHQIADGQPQALNPEIRESVEPRDDNINTDTLR